MRQIYTVTASQCVISDAHPEGVYSTLPDYPKRYDSRNYSATETNPNGDEELALICAKADFADIVKSLSLARNRAMWTVTLERADGRQIMYTSWGAMPDMTPPKPQPEPQPEAEA